MKRMETICREIGSKINLTHMRITFDRPANKATRPYIDIIMEYLNSYAITVMRDKNVLGIFSTLHFQHQKHRPNAIDDLHLHVGIAHNGDFTPPKFTHGYIKKDIEPYIGKHNNMGKLYDYFIDTKRDIITEFDKRVTRRYYGIFCNSFKSDS